MHSSNNLNPTPDNRVLWCRLHIAVLIMFMALSLLGGSTISTSGSGSSGGGCAPGDSGCRASKVSLEKLDAHLQVMKSCCVFSGQTESWFKKTQSTKCFNPIGCRGMH